MDKIGLSLDFSNISLPGIIALAIISFFVCAIVFILLHTLKNVKINTEKLSIETRASTAEVKEIAKSQTKTAEDNRNILKKQKRLTEHYVMQMSGDFRELFKMYIPMMSDDGRNTIRILIYAMLLNISSMVVDNFADNHIGDSDSEIEQYTRIRAREYEAYIMSFLDEFDWAIPDLRIKATIELLPKDYMFEHLYVIFRDGKQIEKNIKEAAND